MKSLLLALLVLFTSVAGVSADEVTHWNRVATDAAAAAQTDPLTESRAFAMLHVAIHDAVNAVDARYQTYDPVKPAEAGARPEAAASAAAHDVLVAVFPAASAKFDAALAESLSSMPRDAATEKGLAAGRAAASATLAARRRDGAERSVAYAPGTKAGQYRPTPPDFTPAWATQWGGVKPFVLASSSQFRPAPPPAVDSESARADIAVVRAVGKNEGSTRNEEQSEISRFWYENSTQGWNRIARAVSESRGLDLHENARLFALVNLAMADGYVASLEAKYHYAYWRPATAIRNAGDENWLSDLPTPPIPDYPSGHAMAGAAAATVMERCFGSDFVSFRVTSGAPYPGITRGFWSFSEAARENSASRVLAGIHFPTAVAAGYDQGEAVGGWVFAHALRPVGSDAARIARVDGSRR